MLLKARSGGLKFISICVVPVASHLQSGAHECIRLSVLHVVNVSADVDSNTKV